MNVHRPPPTPFFHSDLHCNADIVAASHSPSLLLFLALVLLLRNLALIVQLPPSLSLSLSLYRQNSHLSSF